MKRASVVLLVLLAGCVKVADDQPSRDRVWRRVGDVLIAIDDTAHGVTCYTTYDGGRTLSCVKTKEAGDAAK